MEKVIVNRFPAKCKRCGEAIQPGSRAIWRGKGQGIVHQMCRVEVPAETPKVEKAGADEWTIDYSELRNRYLEIIARPTTAFSRSENGQWGSNLKSMWDGSWSGSTMMEMSEFIRYGYRVEGLENVESLLPAKPKRKLRFADEGDELHLDLAWSGADEPFSEWEKRISKPGLSVEIYMIFSAYFPAKTIAAFQRWIARALQTLDENGVDMEVNIVMPESGSLFQDDPYKATKTKIRVRKPGEAADFANWSAMFSPGGFRHLGFTALSDHADRNGHKIASSLGMPDAYGKWDVAYDADRNIIVFGNSNRETEFPEFEMTEKLRSVLKQVSGVSGG